jgi:ribokinase
MKRYTIVTVGSAVQDIMFVTDQAETLANPKPDPTKLRLIGFEYGAKIRSDNAQLLFGGGAANTAVVLAKLGVQVGTLLRVGNDGTGQAVIKELQRQQVDTSLVQRDQTVPTGFSFLVVEAASNEHVAFAHYGANTQLEVSPGVLRQFKTDWLYVSSLSMKQWPAAMKRLLATKAKLAWNPGATQLAAPLPVLRPLLRRTEILIVNRDEATELALRFGVGRTLGWGRKLAGEFPIVPLAQALAATGPRICVITDGRAGAYACKDGHLYYQPTVKRKPKDTTGAGDAFGSSFVAAIVKRPYDLPLALKIATINATAQVDVVGAQTGVLTWAQIKRHLPNSH